jgi:enolase
MEWMKMIGMDGKLLTDKIGDKVQLDDLFVTNVERLSTGIEEVLLIQF